MAVELESVMRRLGDQTRLLKERSRARTPGDDDRALMVEGLALVSEAVLKIGRDVRQLRLQTADRP